MPIPKKLDEIVRLPLFERLPSSDIRGFWLQQFDKNERVVAGVMAKPEFESFKEK